MLKISRTLLPAVMAVMVTAGCGGGTTSDTSSPAPSAAASDAPPAEAADPEALPERGDADLVIWTDAVKLDGVTKVADAFAGANGISVSVQAISSDLQTNFVTANAAGNGPDVVVGAHDWIGNLVQNGSIEPLQISASDLSGYSEKAVAATTYDSKLYGVPYGIEALALYRNTEVVPDEPASLDAAIADGKAAVKAKKVDSALNLPVGELGDAYHMEPILTSMGGYIFAEDADGGYDPSDVGIGKPGSLAAAEKISQLAKDNVLRTSISGDNSIALFTEGKAAFLVSGPWALGDVEASGIKFAIQPVPGFEGEDDAAPFMGAQSFMVASGGANPAIAQEFINTGVNTEEAMQTLYESTKLPPAMIAVQDSVDDDNLAIFAKAANDASPLPSLPAMASVFAPLGKAYSAIVGGADPDKTMKAAGKTITDEIADQ